MYTQDDELLIWKYLDQKCSSDEEALFHKKLNNYTTFQKQYETIVMLHNQLKNQEYEVPSLRFSKNVMEALPKRRPSKIEYFRPSRFLSLGYLAAIFSMVFSVVAYLFLADYQPSGSTASIYTDFTEASRQPLWLQTSWILISCFTLLLLDRFILSRNRHHKSTSPV